MKHCKSLFLKQDLFKTSTFVFWTLALLSGGSIIYSREYLGGGFRIDNIYAMFSSISEWMLMFVAASLFGKEFQNRTINMIRISKRSHVEILFRKLMVMLIISMLTALISFAEVAIYSMIYSQDVELLGLLSKMILAYCLYGSFVFAFTTSIVMMLKNTFQSFIAVLLTVAFFPILLKVLSTAGISEKGLQVIPFTFMRSSFSFAKFTASQVIVMGIWNLVLLVIAHGLLKKRGYV